MKYLMTAAMALALAAGAASVRADPQDNNGDQHQSQGGHNGGQGQGGGQGGGQGQQGHHHDSTGGQHGAQGQSSVQGQSGGHGQSGGQGQSGGVTGAYGRVITGVVVPRHHDTVQSYGGEGSQGGQENGHNGRGGQSFNGEQGSNGAVAGVDVHRHHEGGALYYNGGQGGEGQNEHSSGASHYGWTGALPGQNHDLRDRDRGRDWFDTREFPREFRAEHRFHDHDDYGYPPGWYARTWFFGNFLPFGWYTSDYYLTYWDYDLPEPPIGCEWIREGHDALLVDVWTGRVVSVYSGIFW
ncbi:MAG: RcnB family protein [Caulobacterales bacterium]